MLYFQVYQLDKSVVHDNILVPTYLSEYEYTDVQAVYDTLHSTYYHYVDIHEVTSQVLQLGYKQVYCCYWIDKHDKVQCDILAIQIVAYN